MTKQVSVKLSADELAAWRGLLRVHAAVVGALDADLVAAHDLPLSSYEVLLHLAEEPDGRLRMSEIAGRALLSQSGLTRLVDRLVRDGLVERVRCAGDRRGSYAAITAAGRERLREARGTHLAGVRDRFLASLDADDLAALASAWERVLPGAAAVHSG